MADIRLVNVAKAFQGLSHQVAALNWLQERVPPDVLAQFAELYRADPPAKPEASPSPGVDWLTPCRKLVQEFEGCRLVAYPDPGTGGDPWTVGWGHTGPDVRQGVKWTQQQADATLDAELSEFRSHLIRLLPMAPRWSGAQQAALVSFAFNVGAGALEDSTLRRRLLAGEDPATVVREELPRWINKGSPVEAGLMRRRAAEVALFTSGQPAADAALSWPIGTVGPKKRPDLKPGDHHLIANDINQTLTAYSAGGQRLWSIPCLCRGQGGEAEWNTTRSDTPPGLYRIGKVYRDYEADPSPQNRTADRQAYGWFSFDLEGLEGQEGPGAANGRDGIMIHGGGTANGWPGAWAPLQPLPPTLGCIRCHNLDLKERILPLVGMGTVWVSVLQETP